jgi:hypothetical protein
LSAGLESFDASGMVFGQSRGVFMVWIEAPERFFHNLGEFALKTKLGLRLEVILEDEIVALDIEAYEADTEFFGHDITFLE